MISRLNILESLGFRKKVLEQHFAVIGSNRGSFGIHSQHNKHRIFYRVIFSDFLLTPISLSRMTQQQTCRPLCHYYFFCLLVCEYVSRGRAHAIHCCISYFAELELFPFQSCCKLLYNVSAWEMLIFVLFFDQQMHVFNSQTNLVISRPAYWKVHACWIIQRLAWYLVCVWPTTTFLISWIHG